MGNGVTSFTKSGVGVFFKSCGISLENTPTFTVMLCTTASFDVHFMELVKLMQVWWCVIVALCSLVPLLQGEVEG